MPFPTLFPSDILKFVCLFVSTFVWAINHVKIYEMSRNLDTFFNVNNFSSYTKNCDLMLDTFLQGHMKIFIQPFESLFSHYILISTLISSFFLCVCVCVCVMKRSRFHDDIIVDSVAVRQCKVSLSVYLSTCLV